MDTQGVICSLKFSENHNFKEIQKAIDNCENKVQVYWAEQISESAKADGMSTCILSYLMACSAYESVEYEGMRSELLVESDSSNLGL